MTFQIALQCTMVRSLPTPLKAIAKRFHHSLSYMDMKPNNIIPPRLSPLFALPSLTTTHPPHCTYF
jgi:hypothetical protein